MRPAESTVPDLVAIEDLDRNILDLSKLINTATYELLVLVREFDERGGYVKWGLNNCAEWLAWRCDLAAVTAKEKVRTAHALKALPQLSASFSTGEISYTKVRELTRVANKQNENALLEFALRHTAVQVTDRCQEMRMGREHSSGIAERAVAVRSLRLRRNVDRGIMVVSMELPLESGELLEKALDKARDDECLEIPDLADTSWSARQADAFVNVLNDYLGGAHSEGASDNYLVTVHVDQSALAGEEGRSALPIETMKRLCCDSQAVVITENDKGEPLSIGRKSRLIPTAIQRAVRARDSNCCTFPGCKNHRFLHCHHVEHWSRGGDTSLDNLLLLCTKHHTLVHEGGFRIEKDFRDDWYFMRPDGIAVPACGYHYRDRIDEDTGELLQNEAPAGVLLSVAERTVEEPPPPQYLH